MNSELTEIRSFAFASISGTTWPQSLAGLALKLFLVTAARSGQSSSLGVPMVSKIFVSWSISYWPGNKGLRRNSSAKMQPHDQMSTGVAYDNPIRTSGLRYHSVTTCRSEYGQMLIMACLFSCILKCFHFSYGVQILQHNFYILLKKLVFKETR